jgi:LacI family transcriptional regulator
MTLKEIAKQAGVSTATVSYVLNDSPKISEKTKEKVMRIIRETGYQPNAIAKSLRKQHTGLIGILAEDITVWHTSLIIDGINRFTEEHGFNTILTNLRLESKISSEFTKITDYRNEIDKAMDVLISMKVDGIIYIGMHDRAIDHVLQKASQPVVFCYCYTTDEEGASVRYDNETAFYRITRMIIEKGHRRIALIRGNENSEPAQLRLRGFCRAVKEAGIDVPKKWNLEGHWSFDNGRKAAIQLLTRGEGYDKTPEDLLPDEDRPSAVICMNDDMAVGVYYAAAQLGLRIPDDLTITGFDNTEISRQLFPPLVTVERPLQKMGFKAMEILYNSLEGDSDGNINVVYPCRIIPGGSVRDLTDKKDTI